MDFSGVFGKDECVAGCVRVDIRVKERACLMTKDTRKRTDDGSRIDSDGVREKGRVCSVSV